MAALALVIVAAFLPPDQALAASSDERRTFSRDHTLDLRDAYLANAARSARGVGSAASRPTDPADGSGEFFWDPAAPQSRVCSDRVCVHYVTTTSDAPPLAAADGVNPDWVRRNLDVTEFALTRMAELGYSGVPSDGGLGDSAQFDVYLADISRAGLYGYCAPEAPVPGAPGHASSFCVFDNDFRGFPMPPDESLRVTAAHELFHAVQFGIDVDEDRWFMESTATWMEEQVADDDNDNRQYLSSGQLGRRHVPLDHAASDLGIYGNWIFFQFLAQRYGVDAVRQIWLLADAGPGRRNDFSIEAVRHFIESRHSTFPAVYAAFALANLAPGRGYEEGHAYRAEAVDDLVRLGAGRSTWRDQRIGVPHLTARAIAFRPRAGLRAQARLRVTVSAARSSGAAVSVQVHRVSGKVTTLRLRRGHGSRVVNFAGARVRRVVVVLANASTRYDCGQRTHFACHGTPRDDRQRFAITATLVRRPR
ncbi:MXAN_6640 family putative metalloprotease [Nocardioides sp.]|uniref:MXAN_6640 family putative metalloprotease n=1 Tax=Nocardioides sp. TaxID=35761 RepID=UPI00286E04E6|nr:MXAN_6640 family putative metalloprotease [Nocardioides sp.]